MKKSILKLLTVGFVLALVSFLVIFLIKNKFNWLSNFSFRQEIIVYIACFIVPFGYFPKFNVSKGDPIVIDPKGYPVAGLGGGNQSNTLIALTILLLELSILFITAPVFIFYKIYALVKMELSPKEKKKNLIKNFSLRCNYCLVFILTQLVIY